MFVAMGLSAIFPVLHGVEMYSIPEMRQRIGLVWLVSQGALYILGAGIYAVSIQQHSEDIIENIIKNIIETDYHANCLRHDGRNALRQESTIFGVAPTKSSIYW